MVQLHVLIVTYGNRWNLLQATLQHLLPHAEITHITIVNNGSGYDLQAHVQAMGSNIIHVLDLPDNTGSANAYGIGMQLIASTHPDHYIWLLDDDLTPAPDCVRILCQAIDADRQSRKGMYLCMRSDRSYLKLAAKNVHPELFFPLPNAFLGFNIFRPDIRRQKKHLTRTIAALPDAERVNIPCAPYGGLVIHAQLIAELGVPDAGYFAYADDFAYTLAFTQHGGSIQLLPYALVHDNEPTLVNLRQTGILSQKFFDMPDRRLFLLMRNTAYYTRRMLVTSPPQFIINKTLYSGYLWLTALLYGKMRSFKIYNFAIRQGMRGILRNEDIPAQ